MDRLKELDDPDPGYMPIVPDLAVEVISPGDLVYAVDENSQAWREPYWSCSQKMTG
jgi:Uma2 family endonuclease